MENKENRDQNAFNENSVSNAQNSFREARKKGMIRGILATVIVSIIIMIAAGSVLYSRYMKENASQMVAMEDQKSSFSKQLVTRDSLINEWLLAFDEIEKDMKIIKQKESILTVQSSDSELTKDRKEQILEDIRYINALLESNKKKIASLNAQLKNSGTSMKGLETKIASLETSVKEHENEISDLKIVLVNKDFEIGQMNNQMTDLEMALLMQEEKINSQTNIIKQAFLTSGTAKDLEEKGIILKEGGFLGLGKTELLTSDFEDSLFTKINVDETKTIPVNSKNVRLITEHPSSSYEFVQESEDQIAYIEIKDPEEFWKISKYAVVELKNK